VKLVLPALLKGVEDKAWRTKQGSIQLLGAMAYCAPKQLSTCLPTIVPRLSGVLTDPHPRVQTAARTALNEVCIATHTYFTLQGAGIADSCAAGSACRSSAGHSCSLAITLALLKTMVIIKERMHLRMSAAVLRAQVGSVIRNPEVSVLVPTLLAAITDPGKHTRATLEVRPVVEENSIDSSTPLMAMVFVAQPIRFAAMCCESAGSCKHQNGTSSIHKSVDDHAIDPAGIGMPIPECTLRMHPELHPEPHSRPRNTVLVQKGAAGHHAHQHDPHSAPKHQSIAIQPRHSQQLGDL